MGIELEDLKGKTFKPVDEKAFEEKTKSMYDLIGKLSIDVKKIPSIEEKINVMEKKVGTINMEEIARTAKQLETSKTMDTIEMEKKLQEISGKKMDEVCKNVECMTKEITELTKRLDSINNKMGVLAIDVDDLINKHYFKCPGCGKRVLALGDKICKDCGSPIEWE